jgi:hypothetical protein
MPVESHKIYVIIGSCGAYSDHSEWPVTWRPTLKEAEDIVKILTEQADAFDSLSHVKRREANELFPEYELQQTMLDQSFSSYYRTTYRIWAISDDFRTDHTTYSKRHDIIDELIKAGEINQDPGIASYLKEKICLFDGCHEDGYRLWHGGPCIYLCKNHYDGSRAWFEQFKRHPINEIDTIEYVSGKVIDMEDWDQ